MENVVVNVNGQVTRVVRDGRKHLMAPATILVGDRVLNGSNGPLFYSAKACGANPGAWNGIDVVLGHPTDEHGNPVAVRNADGSIKQWVIDKFGLGKTDNDSWDGIKRTVNVLFDEERTRKLAPQVYKNLNANQPFELSTGLGTRNAPALNGAHANGTPYTHTAEDHRPDHLAILVGQKGACDLGMGCGVLNARHCETCGGDPEPVTNEEKKSLLRKLGEMLGLVTTDNAFCPTGKGSGQDNSCSSEVGGGSQGPKGPGATAKSKESLKRMIDFHTKEMNSLKRKYGKNVKDNPSYQRQRDKLRDYEKQLSHHTHNDDTTNQTTEDNDMDRKAVIADITANCECFKGKEKLLANAELFSDADLAKIVADQKRATENALVVNAVKEQLGEDEITANAMPAAFAKFKKKGMKKAPVEDEEDEDEGKTCNEEFDPKKIHELPAEQRLTADERDALDTAKHITNQARKHYVDLIVNANADTDEDKKEIRPVYEAMKLPVLKKLADKIAKAGATRNQRATRDEEVDTVLDYAGAALGGYRQTGNAQPQVDEDDILEPTYNWDAEEAKRKAKEAAAAK